MTTLDLLPDADALLIVPPFAHLTWPSLGVHLLQAQARARGLRVAVLYANLLLGARVGAALYGSICNAPMDWLLGERLLARAAWGRDALDEALFALVREHNRTAAPHLVYVDHLSQAAGVEVPPAPPRFDPAELLRVREVAEALVAELAQAIAARGYRVVGASTTFEQTAAAVALLEAVGDLSPDTALLIGGANCDGEQAAGIAGLTRATVVSGEADLRFPELLGQLLGGERPAERVVACEAVAELDNLREPEFSEYFDQLHRALPGWDAPIWLSGETSRGCWWGERHRCTFCGLNGSTIGFRRRAPARVLAELAHHAAAHGVRRVAMADNILPHQAHRDLLPLVQGAVPGAELFFEIKANLRRDQIRGLVQAGVVLVQPGIEALSTPLLDRMSKGLRASGAVSLLRDARTEGLKLNWNLLYGLPGDEPADYAGTTSIIPLLVHLQPPMAMGHVILDRFSAYWAEPARWGITHIRPRPSMAQVYPEGADLMALSVHFAATFPSDALDSPEIDALSEAVRRWQALWWERPRPPMLHMAKAGGQWALTDTRGLGTPQWLPLSAAQVELLSGAQDLDHPLAKWALRGRLAVPLDGRLVTLVTGGEG